MSVSSSQPPAILAQVMQTDRYQLLRRWRKLSRHTQTDPRLLDRWMADAEASAAVFNRRRQSVPELSFDTDLPITAHRDEIVSLLSQRQTIVVCGETGSGKSTQLPKLCLEAGLGARGLIGHTQPRRLAARAVASRLAEELNTRIGEQVGFKIRFTDTTVAQTLIKLMTDGVLLAETQSDRYLDQYDALIIDEAHERSLNIDFLLGYLRQISARRPDLKLIITSATIDPQRFAEHFSDEHGPAPIVEVSGRTYPVEIRYRDLPQATEFNDANQQQQLVAITEAADELLAEGSGDILVFLPTERDIRATAKHLRGHFTRTGSRIDILPLYARLSQAEQNKIFAAHSHRRIVLATNVAESSLTVPGIHFVIDTGLVRISRYAPRSKVQRLPIEGVSQASANQRSGRCGRLGPGVCIRLFSEEDFQSRSRFTTPEIRRSDLASVLLQSKILHLGPLEEFPLLDPPTTEAIRDAVRSLREIGALTAAGELSTIGKQLGKLPCEPRIGRMLIEADQRNCLAEVVVIAAAIETQDVRQRPAGQRPQADEAHAQFADPHSDFLAYLRIWDFYDNLRSQLGRSRLQKALQQNFLSYQGCREWADIVRQLKDLLSAAGIPPQPRRFRLPNIDRELLEGLGEELVDTTAARQSVSPRTSTKLAKKKARSKPQSAQTRTSTGSQGDAGSSRKKQLVRPAGYAPIHQSLLSGLLSGVAHKGDQYEYKAVGGLTISLWPGSGLFKRKPKWIMASEIVETSKRYGRTIAEIDVEWIETAAGDLLKHSYSDPHWSSKSGAAMVYRKSTLYGLPIVVGRRAQLAPIDAGAARDLLIEHGLVAGQWHCREAFYLHNQEMVADMHELAQRTRSRDYILDRFHLANFYSARLPTEIYDLATLRAWLRKHHGQPAERALWMQPDDLLADSPHEHSLESEFPNALTLGQTELPLEYHFEPGHEADGVTVTVPQAALRQISPELLGWLVPGLLEEKILHLIRTLPKTMRTSFLPAPDVARKLAEEIRPLAQDQPFMNVLCQAMSNYAGDRILASHFEVDRLPPHLQMQVRVVDNDGATLDCGRNVSELISKHAPPPTSTSGQPQTACQDWTNFRITPDTFESIPGEVCIRRGGVNIAAFPALIDLGNAVEMQLVDHASDAQRLSQRGLTRLFALKHQRILRAQVSHLPNLTQHSLRLGHVVNSQDLGSQLQDLIARVALVEDQAPIADHEEFEARSARAPVQISIATQQIADWLPKLAEQVHQVRLAIEQAPGPWRIVIQEIQVQVQAMLHANFLNDTPWRWLAEFPRYLQAVQARIDKMKNGGVAKDQKLSEPIVAVCHGFEKLRASIGEHSDPAPLVELRWMIEELRVSIFAQQLGTKISVSPKRIQKLIDNLSHL